MRRYDNSKELGKIKIRQINSSDKNRVEMFQEYINSLVEEDAMVLVNRKVNFDEEKNGFWKG